MNLSEINLKTNGKASTTLVNLYLLDTHIANIQLLDEKGKNCFSELLISELIESLKIVRNNDAIKAVILSGLPDVFCAGANMEMLRELAEGDMKPMDIILSKMLLDIPVPVISAMEGHGVGGGLALGLCADIVILAEESRYGCSFMNMGFTPGMGITKLLEHYMTPAIAHELQYTGQFRKGRDFKGKTNFNYILPKEEVMSTALQLAASISEKPIKAIKALKRYLSMHRRKTFEETYSIESMMHELTFDQKDILKSIEENYVR